MAKKSKAAKAAKPRPRRERRFEPNVGTSPSVIYLLGAIGAIAMGAGAWEEFAPLVSDATLTPLKFAPYVLTAGALMVGGAIWTGTSGEPALRVGDSGLAVEKGSSVKRMSWYDIGRIDWRDEIVRVEGKDDSGAPMTLTASLRNQPQAAAWLVTEARARVPAVVHVPEDASLPDAIADAGTLLDLDPPRVVGRHCAASGKVISYEPDARICPRCERVFHKAHVPVTCECGASLGELRAVNPTV
jgi:hypothetical protein